MFYFQMNGWQALKIQGPDAKDFLYRITSTDFKKYQAPGFTLGTLLSANGKIILYFKVFIQSETEFLFLIPQGVSVQPPEEVFEKLHFRENLKITPQPDPWTYLRVVGNQDESLRKLESLLTTLKEIHRFNENKWCQSFWNEKPSFTFDLGLLFPKNMLLAIEPILEKSGFKKKEDAEPYRILAGDPAAPSEINSTIIPLEAELSDAIHENKGCYPGQEVIERIKTMGQVPRRLILLRGEGNPPTIPQKMTTQNLETKEMQEVGTLTSAAVNPTNPSQWVGLGFIKRMYAKPEIILNIDGKPAQVQFK